jgi:WD40 repeat protein
LREREAKKARNDEPLNRPGVEVELQTECEVLAVHGDWVRALNISADGRRVITGGDECVTIVWDLASRQEVARWKGHPLTWVVSAALSPDGEKAFVAEFGDSRGSFDRPPAQARLYDASTGSELIDLLKVQFPDVKVRDNSYGYSRTWGKFVARGFVSSEFSPDGKLLAVAQGGETGSGKVHLIDAETGKLVRTFADHKSGALDVRFTSDGKYVLSTGRDTVVQIHQASDGKEVARLGKGRGGQFKDWLHAIDLSPDEKWLAAADISGLVELWSIDS